MRARTELRRLLNGAIEIAKEHGPYDYHGPVSKYLSEHGVTGSEAHWISPRLIGWVHGARWGFLQARQLEIAIALDLDVRVN